MQVEQGIFHTKLRSSPVERSRETVLGVVYLSQNTVVPNSLPTRNVIPESRTITAQGRR